MTTDAIDVLTSDIITDRFIYVTLQFSMAIQISSNVLVMKLISVSDKHYVFISVWNSFTRMEHNAIHYVYKCPSNQLVSSNIGYLLVI